LKEYKKSRPAAGFLKQVLKIENSDNHITLIDVEVTKVGAKPKLMKVFELIMVKRS